MKFSASDFSASEKVASKLTRVHNCFVVNCFVRLFIVNGAVPAQLSQPSISISKPMYQFLLFFLIMCLIVSIALDVCSF